MANGIKGVYNLYEDGELVLENVYAEDIREFLGNEKLNVPHYAMNGIIYGEHFAITKGDPDLARSIFAKAWDEAVAPFRRVQWVKSGGRKLGGC